jgi:Tol biopolymer transport system component
VGLGGDEPIPFGPDLSTTFTFVDDLAASPDGSRLTFTGQRRNSAEFQIYMMDAAGHDPVALTEGPSNNGNASWSPDGSKISFVSSRDGNLEIYVMDANGANPVRLTDDPAADTQPAWRP